MARPAGSSGVSAAVEAPLAKLEQLVAEPIRICSAGKGRLCAGVKERVAVLSLVWLAGCATSALEMAPERPDRPWAPATTASGEIIAGAAQAPPTARRLCPARQSGPRTGSVTARASIPPGSIRFPELIDLAESSNPATRIAWNDARRAALAAGIAESAFLPNITATAIGGYQGSSGRQTALGTSFSSNPSLDGTVSALSLQWLLFDFGEARRRGGRGEAGIGDLEHRVHRRTPAADLRVSPLPSITTPPPRRVSTPRRNP